MQKIKVGDYLFRRIEELGVDTTFGIPGDFVLPVYAAQTRSSLKTVVMTHEPSVGFAADAYGRLRGLGVAIVTYGAGGLNMVNSVGLAYAEESPVLIISGSPETRYREEKPMLHHCVKSFDTQYRVFEEVTESQALLLNPLIAREEIDRIIDTTVRLSKPGYIEIPRDMVNQEVSLPEKTRTLSDQTLSPAIEEAARDVIERLRNAERPVLLVGVQVRRFQLKDRVIALAEALNIPVVTSILGKACFPETHPNFIGNYFGQFGNPAVREYVESSDCVLSLGCVLTEMETGGYTAVLPQATLIQANSHSCTVGYRTYHAVDLQSLVCELFDRLTSKVKPAPRYTIPLIEREDLGPKPGANELTVASMIEDLNAHLSDSYSVISDVGDCLYAGMSLETDIFIAPGYYSSMGFGVPAAIGAQLAHPERRPIVLVGDGGFQMTGMEISTAAKLGLNPIVIVFNNKSYAMLRFIDQEREYYKLPTWDYAAIARAVGGRGVQAQSRKDFQRALQEAERSNELFLIDAVLQEDDISPTLKRLTDHFGAKVKAAL